MKIPTGGVTLTVTASQKRYIKFRCPSCGGDYLAPYLLKAEAQGGYHALNSQSKKDDVKSHTQSTAARNLTEKDDRLFREINKEHVYNSVCDKVICPGCGAQQPWSGFQKPWTRSGYVIWGLLAAALSFLTIYAFSGAVPGKNNLGQLAVFFLLALVAVVSVLAVHLLRIKLKEKKCAEAGFVPPVYYNRENIGELIEQVGEQRLAQL